MQAKGSLRDDEMPEMIGGGRKKDGGQGWLVVELVEARGCSQAHYASWHAAFNANAFSFAAGRCPWGSTRVSVLVGMQR